ncbi:MAG: hypothetical protein L0H96_07315 [Humibacillus sp.]|nr:hypothetical protein [Humibacillus sp.]MDN5776702.1 hypothetical protein [Humibacillus sp.]
MRWPTYLPCWIAGWASCGSEPSARRRLHRQPGRLRSDPAGPQRLIERRAGTNTYDQSPDGLRVAIFYTKVHDHLLRPLIAADQPPRCALATIGRTVHQYAHRASLAAAA